MYESRQINLGLLGHERFLMWYMTCNLYTRNVTAFSGDCRTYYRMLVQAYSPVAVTQILHNAAHADASQVDPDSRNISVKARVRQDNHHDREGKRWVRRRDNCEK